MAHLKQLPSIAHLREVLRYDPITGNLYWNRRQGDDRGTKSFNSRFADKIAGCLVATGYISVNISDNGKSLHFRAHRIAWALKTGTWPEVDQEIDHRNNRRADNRWRNLRLADHLNNGASKQLARNSSTGFKGVTRREGLPRPWKAQIRRGSKKASLGYFSTPQDAARAYDIAAIQQFGDFAKTNASMGLLG